MEFGHDVTYSHYLQELPMYIESDWYSRNRTVTVSSCIAVAQSWVSLGRFLKAAASAAVALKVL